MGSSGSASCGHAGESLVDKLKPTCIGELGHMGSRFQDAWCKEVSSWMRVVGWRDTGQARCSMHRDKGGDDNKDTPLMNENTDFFNLARFQSKSACHGKS